jgi:hypothetical protein
MRNKKTNEYVNIIIRIQTAKSRCGKFNWGSKAGFFDELIARGKMRFKRHRKKRKP